MLTCAAAGRDAAAPAQSQPPPGAHWDDVARSQWPIQWPCKLQGGQQAKMAQNEYDFQVYMRCPYHVAFAWSIKSMAQNV